MAQKEYLSIPIAFEFCPVQAHWKRLPGDLLQPVPADKQLKVAKDAWVMRQEFFRLERGNLRTLLKFLNKWGWWRECSRAELSLLKSEKPISAASIWDTQERFRRAVKEPIGEWLYAKIPPREGMIAIENQGHNLLFQTHLNPTYPHHRVCANAGQPALQATITIDLLRGVRFRQCARRDCRAPFEIKSKHEKKYCSLECAHLVSVRNQRSAKQASQKKLQSGEAAKAPAQKGGN